MVPNLDWNQAISLFGLAVFTRILDEALPLASGNWAQPQFKSWSNITTIQGYRVNTGKPGRLIA